MLYTLYMVERIEFNLSPSSINLYKESQLRFYYKYIAKLEPTDSTIDCYGLAGNIVHTVIEKKDIDLFAVLWYLYDMQNKLDFKKKPLDYDQYLQCCYDGLDIADFYTEDGNYNLEFEKEILLDWCSAFNNDVEFGQLIEKTINIKLKGIIDVYANRIIYTREYPDMTNEDDYIQESFLLDWKTSNSIDHSGQHELQAKHYCYLIYKTTGVIPDRFQFEYLKLYQSKNPYDSTVNYYYDVENLKLYEEELIELTKEIISKGTDITKYEIGKIDSPFNEYKSLCLEEQERRVIK